MTLVAILVTALALSVLYCIEPDAVNTEALRRGFSGGFRRGMMVELGSIIGDIFWATLAMTGLAVLIGEGYVRLSLGILGCAILLIFAWSAMEDTKLDSLPESKMKRGRSDFVTGALISLGNPLTIVFWISIGGMAIEMVAVGGETVHYIVFFAGFMIGVVAWCFIFPMIIGFGRRFLNVKFFRFINLACAFLMINLAMMLFTQVVV